jgi:hypothetical protein
MEAVLALFPDTVFYAKPPNDMAKHNHCRLFLQVISLNDITSADGTYILPEVKLGQAPIGWTSKLDWPNQGKPTKQDWQLWQYHLAFLEQYEKLYQKYHPIQKGQRRSTRWANW